ncbi:MAG: ABC transporter permease [Clostridiales bacterium]|nr:ABC transporter permease [Clostridiales bacterium]
MQINPVLGSEMKRNMRSMKGSWMIMGVNLFMTIVAVVTYFGTGGRKPYLEAGQYQFPIQCYMMMAYALFAMVCVLVPGVAGGSIAIERERKTLDILLTTHLSPWKIVIGKLEASLCVIFLIAFSALPVISLILVFGGVAVYDLLVLVLILVVSGIFIGSVGIFCSAVIKKTTIATIVSYVIVIFLALGTVAVIAVVHQILGVRAEQMGNYNGVDMGWGIYLFCLNPVIIYFGMLSKQVGNGFELVQICNQFGDYSNDFGVVHMLAVSLVVQMLISVLLLVLAGKNINPLRK